jgi:putative membrane protein
MKYGATTIAGLAGAGLLAWIASQQDWRSLAVVLAGAGWGVTAMSAFHALPLFLDTLAWRRLLPRDMRPRLPALLLMRWHGESVNALLPVAQVGGDLLRARAAARAGVAAATAAASVLVDLTLSVLTLLLFGAGGAAFLLLEVRAPGVAAPLATALALAVVAVTGFWWLQRTPLLGRLLGAIGNLGGEFWRAAGSGADAFAAALAAIWADRHALAGSSVLQLAAWLAGAGEVWIGLAALGHPVSVADALLVESLVQAIRNAAFPVPGALGVQDGGLMLIAPLAGIPAEVGLALALLKRGRELAFGLPGLAHLYRSTLRDTLNGR